MSIDPLSLRSLDPRLQAMLDGILSGQAPPPTSSPDDPANADIQDLFEKLKADGGYADDSKLGGDVQAMLEMLILLLEKKQSEESSKPPPPRNVGSLGSPTSSPSYAPSSTGAPAGVSGPTSTPTATPTATPPANTAQGPTSLPPVKSLKGDDKQTAEFINKHLADQKSPAANAKSPSAGEMMVQAGKQYKVDPLVLLSIAGHETGYGKLGVGMQKMLGVSAYDSDPSNKNPTFDGLKNQIFKGAETFANLREQNGSSEKDDIAKQLAAVGPSWATDDGWNEGVGTFYQQIGDAAAKFKPSDYDAGKASGDVKSVQDAAKFLLNSKNVSYWDGLSSGSEQKTMEQIAKTGKAYVPATGETVTPNLDMMKSLVDMAKSGPIMINALTGGEHSTGSNHYSGLAVDLDLSTGNAAQIEAIANQHGGTRNYETDHIHLDFVS